jgi:hypothetical protein
MAYGAKYPTQRVSRSTIFGFWNQRWHGALAMATKKRATTGKKRTTRPKSKRREPERDYSHRLLVDKLGVRTGQTIAVIGVDDSIFLDELAKRVPNFFIALPGYPADLIFYAVEDKSDLAEIKKLAKAIASNGAVWAVYPKGQAHIRETDVIDAAKAAGLTDNKVCRFSETHTALRLCIPVAKR